MAIIPTVPLADWKPLYDAAVKFNLLSPWDWMGDEDVFARRDVRHQRRDFTLAERT